MNDLPPELQHALQNQRLLIVWGDLPFELPPRVTGERSVVINRMAVAAAQLPELRIRLSVTPPLPILSLDSTDRVEREFGSRPLNVLLTRRDVPNARLHNLIKLAGDLNSRAGLILSREEVQHLRADDDKRYLLDLVRRVVEDGAAIIVKDLAGFQKLARSEHDFQAWWSIIRPAFGSAPIFAAGEPSSLWPEEVTYLGSAQDVVNAAFANIKAPVPELESPVSFGLPPETPATTTRSGGVEVQARQVEIGGDVVGRDKVSAGGHVIHAETGSTVIINEPVPAPEPASGKPVMPIDVQTLRVDAAVPEEVYVDHVFDLAVAVRQATSPPLAVKDLTHVESGEVQTTWEQGTPLINLRAEVEAPDCAIIGKSSIPFRLVRGHDSPLLRFPLKPLRAGALSIAVTVYQEDYWLGSARVNTVAAAEPAQPAGKVQLTLTSQPLDALPPPAVPPPGEEAASLQRQLREARENLRLIEDRKAEYVLEVDVPLQLIKEERRLRTRLAELEAQLSLAGQEPNAVSRAANHLPAARPWNYATLRQLLNDAFSDEELTSVCFDHFPTVYDAFGAGMSKSQKIQNLIEHCKRNLDVERLLNIISAQNPAQFARFEAGLHL